jgi:hypothetical protein
MSSRLLSSFRNQINLFIYFFKYLSLILLNLLAANCFALALEYESGHSTILPDQTLSARFQAFNLKFLEFI